MPYHLKRRPYSWPASPGLATRSRPTLMVLIAAMVGLFTISGMLPKRIVVLNLSPSAPLGLYYAVHDEPRTGRWVEFLLPVEPPSGPYRTPQQFALKPIFAGPGDHIDTTGDYLWVNGQRVAPIYITDSNGHPLPVWRANRALEDDEFFVFSARVPNSFDSRYYGPIRRSDITTVRAPLWIWPESTDNDMHRLEPESNIKKP